MRWLVVVGMMFATATPAAGQLAFEAAGARALGMAGAFVAVADDSTAALWNPAGLVSGPIAGFSVGWDRFQFGNPDTVPERGQARHESRFTTFGTWPLGISFGSYRSVGIVRLTEAGQARVEGVRVSQLGGTVLQTIAPGLVAGVTVKYLRGAGLAAEIEADSGLEALDRAWAAEPPSSGAFDLDVGLMADLGRFRAGVALKNLRTPEFRADAETAIELPRRVRAGLLAIPADGVTLAMDIDLDTADPLVGFRRSIAFGGETRVGERLQLRAGLRWHREDGDARIGAVGASVALRRGFWLDAYVTGGGRREGRGIGIALRAG